VIKEVYKDVGQRNLLCCKLQPKTLNISFMLYNTTKKKMLKTLKKVLESEKKNNRLFDIIIYGSIVKGKDSPGDIDILVIFNEGNLRQRLNEIQRIKSRILSKFSKKKIDIKQSLLKDIFNPEFFAKTGIFLEGYSIFRGRKFSETLGFEPYSLFTYSLKGLSHTQKVKFNYLLAGRTTEGLLKEFKGERLVNGAVKVPLENSVEFEEILKQNRIEYKKRNILEER
tara:strand:- start:1827 stop:2504 length:678 start_codon:yes stop_codon:yes gene_type:complete